MSAARRVPLGNGRYRLILSNGIHRVYRLLAAGYEWCPLIVVDNSPMEIPDPFVDFPKELLLGPTANPPLMADFLNENVAMQLEYHRVLKTIRFNWNFEQYVTVLR